MKVGIGVMAVLAVLFWGFKAAEILEEFYDARRSH